MRELIAVAFATISSSLYALSAALQALEAREAPPETALRASLLTGLVRQRVWVIGALVGIVGWGLQAGALAFASVSLVQPALGLGLIVLLVLGSRMLHERVGPREIGGVIAIASAVAVLGWAAPSETGAFTTGGTWAVGVALVVVTARRTCSASSDARTASRRASRPGSAGPGSVSGTALVDGALADRHFAVAASWGLGVAIATWSALLSEHDRAPGVARDARDPDRLRARDDAAGRGGAVSHPRGFGPYPACRSCSRSSSRALERSCSAVLDRSPGPRAATNSAVMRALYTPAHAEGRRRPTSPRSSRA